MVNQVRCKPPVQTPDLSNDGEYRGRIGAAAPPVQWMKPESMRFNRRATGYDMGGNVHFEARTLRGEGHWQAMREEIPILGDEEDHDWWRIHLTDQTATLFYE